MWISESLPAQSCHAYCTMHNCTCRAYSKRHPKILTFRLHLKIMHRMRWWHGRTWQNWTRYYRSAHDVVLHIFSYARLLLATLREIIITSQLNRIGVLKLWSVAQREVVITGNIVLKRNGQSEINESTKSEISVSTIWYFYDLANLRGLRCAATLSESTNKIRKQTNNLPPNTLQ